MIMFVNEKLAHIELFEGFRLSQRSLIGKSSNPRRRHFVLSRIFFQCLSRY